MAQARHDKATCLCDCGLRMLRLAAAPHHYLVQCATQCIAGIGRCGGSSMRSHLRGTVGLPCAIGRDYRLLSLYTATRVTYLGAYATPARENYEGKRGSYCCCEAAETPARCSRAICLWR